MTTTKALAKLYKAIVGSDGRNSAAKILSDLADNWSSAGLSNAAKIPALPTLAANGTKYYVLKVVKSNDEYGITEAIKEFILK